MKVHFSIYLYFMLCTISTVINVQCSEKFAALKNDIVNNGLLINIREIGQGKKSPRFTGKPTARVTNKPIAAVGKVKPNTPSRQNNLPKQNDNKKKSPSKANAFPQNPKPTLETMIIVGNQNNNMSEIYKLRFTCTDYGCTPDPVLLTDRVWSSPYTEAISEVKAVKYLGKTAVLSSMNDGVIVYEYPSKNVLFRKEFDTNVGCLIHSAEVLPDGNVIAACSMGDGRFGILYRDGNNYFQKGSDTQWIQDAPFAHAVVYRNSNGRIYAGGYLTILVMEYKNRALTVIEKIPIDQYYDEPNKHENGSFEDGIHDMYPVNGDLDNLFVTTGEHAFLFNVEARTLTRHPTLYTIPSQKSRELLKVDVKDKGGIKAISRDAKLNVVIAKSAPWFKEHPNNYYHGGVVVIWSMTNVTNNNGFCHQPDFDLTDTCKIKFHNQLNKFYKLRVFQINAFSYG